MNKAQQQVQQQFLHNEKDALNALKQNYQDALEEINDRIAILLGRSDADMQHVIYQVEYQQALRDQISAILDQMQSNNYTTLSDYLEKSYEDGFIGTMYDLQSQGIPLIFPIDQRQVVEAIQHDTKLSEPLYKRLGKDTKLLKRQISQEISRGISNGEMVNKIAKNIAGYAGISQNNAMRIARTESHRIQIKSAQDAQWKAKEKGADIVKQWDSTLDGNTRDTHRKLDGQIRELDEDFEVDGMTASAPGMFGDPAEDCNCRCALLQRARWALDNDYTKWSEDAPVLISDDGTTQFVNVKANDYDSFKKQYEDITERVQSDVQKINDVDMVFKTKPNSTISPKQKLEDMRVVSNACKNIPAKVMTSIPNVAFEFGHDSNACDLSNKEIRVGIGTTEEEINHEYGHLIEKYMMNQKDVDSYKKSLTNGLSLADIKIKTYYDSVGNPVDILVLEGSQFETEYQSRLYADNPIDALNADGSINTDLMLECISEAFRKYMNNEKISDQALKLIEGAVL